MSDRFEAIRRKILQAFESYSEVRPERQAVRKSLRSREELWRASLIVLDELRDSLQHIFDETQTDIACLEHLDKEEEKLLQAIATGLTWTVNLDHPDVLAYLLAGLGPERHRRLIEALDEETARLFRDKLVERFGP